MGWRGLDEVRRHEKELQKKIYDILRELISNKRFRFHDVLFSEVKFGWSIDHREADLVILGPNPNDAFLIIETKRKEGQTRASGHVTDRAYIGQALTYAALAKRRGINTYFIAVCNPDAIAVYRVPEDVDKVVNWDAIEGLRYEEVIPLSKYPDFLDPNKNAVFTLRLELKEEFFQKLLDDLVLIWKHIKKPIEVQVFTYKVFEDLRSFVSWLSRSIDSLVRESYDELIKKYAEQVERLGYKPPSEHLAREMSYVLMNKILFYKVLERFWHGLPELKTLYGREVNNVRIESASSYLSMLNKFFENAIETTKDFEPIFTTGIYDEIPIPDDPTVLRGIDAFIEYVDFIGIEKLSDVIGYIYEELIPAYERHVLGQFYTPPAVCELITRWCIKSSDDIILGPGCGSGTFEVYGYRRLFELKTGRKWGKEYPSSEIHEKILSQIYALDINEFPAHLTAMNLAMRNPRAPSTKMSVFVADFFTVHPCSPSLLPYKLKVLGTERKEEAYIHIPKVDVVWGNPPYTRWLEIPESTRKAILKTLASENKEYNLIPDPNIGKQPGIYIYWIEHATKFLKEGGRLGMIVSNMWLQADYGVNFGKFLLDHYKVRVLIDVSYRLFEALISTVIILAEKCNDENIRDDNEVLFIHASAKLEPEKLGEILSKIDDYLEGKSTSLSSGVTVNKIKQGEIPRDRKWVSLFFPKSEELVKILEQHELIINAGEWFWPCEGNSIWSIWALQNHKRPGVSPQEFLFFNASKAKNRNIPNKYLVPAITKAQQITTFTFTDNDWKKLENNDENTYMFICHEPRSQLPPQVLEYIRWGEPICPICGARFRDIQTDEQGQFTCINNHIIPVDLKYVTRIRRTRGGGRRGGIIASESYSSRIRQEQGYPPFYGWYDLGGYIPTPLMAIYQAFYHPQFFLCTTPVVTYHAIITLIPKVKIVTESLMIDPRDLVKIYPFLSDVLAYKDITLDERELKALLAYLNSTFAWLWIEQVGRRTGGGIIALEPGTVTKKMPILNVKAIGRSDVEELAGLFDELERNARQIIQTLPSGRKRREDRSEEIGGPKLEMLKQLRPIFRRIDEKIAKILGVDIDVDALWELAWQMMERRVKGSREVTRPGASEEGIVVRTKRGRKRRSSGESTKPLDEFFENKQETNK